MSERYERLFSLPQNLFTVGSPLIVSAGALLKDNEKDRILAQIKFKNVSDKKISAVKISISAFDVTGKALEGIDEFQYLDLNVSTGEEFGQKQVIAMADKVTRSIAVRIISVIFGDGKVWLGEQNAKWEQIQSQESLLDLLGKDLFEQYKRDVSPKAEYVPIEADGLWQCSCGEKNTTGSCSLCRVDKSVVFGALNKDELTAHKEAYDAECAEKEKKLKAQREQQKIQNKKIMKLSLKLASVVAVFVVILLVITKLIVPSAKYSKADKLFQNGQFDEAITVFESLGTFKHSDERISEVTFEKAVHLLNNKEFEEAYKTFNLVDKYTREHDGYSLSQLAYAMNEANDEKNFAFSSGVESLANAHLTERISEELKEYLYNYAIGNCKNGLSSGKYEFTNALFVFLEDYKDSKEKTKNFIVRPSKFKDSDLVYDSNGLLKKIGDISRSNKKKLTEADENKFLLNKDGNISQLVMKNNNSYSVYRFTVKYNSNGLPKKVELDEYRYFSDEKRIFTYEYEKDDKGNIANYKAKFEDNGLYYYQGNIKYDEDTQRVEEIGSGINTYGWLKYEYAYMPNVEKNEWNAEKCIALILAQLSYR